MWDPMGFEIELLKLFDWQVCSKAIFRPFKKKDTVIKAKDTLVNWESNTFSPFVKILFLLFPVSLWLFLQAATGTVYRSKTGLTTDRWLLTSERCLWSPQRLSLFRCFWPSSFHMMLSLSTPISYAFKCNHTLNLNHCFKCLPRASKSHMDIERSLIHVEIIAFSLFVSTLLYTHLRQFVQFQGHTWAFRKKSGTLLKMVYIN